MSKALDMGDGAVLKKRHPLAASGWVRNPRVDKSGGMIQIYGDLETGDKFYFRVRGQWVSLEITSSDADGNKAVRVFTTSIREDLVTIGSATLIQADQAANIVFAWLARFIVARKQFLRRPQEFNLKLYKVTLATRAADAWDNEPEPTAEPTPPKQFVPGNWRRECALSAQNFGLAVVALHGPDGSLLVECHPSLSGCVELLPHAVSVTEVGDEARLPSAADDPVVEDEAEATATA